MEINLFEFTMENAQEMITLCRMCEAINSPLIKGLIYGDVFEW